MANTVNFIVLVVEIRSLGLTDVGVGIQSLAHSAFHVEIHSVKICKF